LNGDFEIFRISLQNSLSFNSRDIPIANWGVIGGVTIIKSSLYETRKGSYSIDLNGDGTTTNQIFNVFQTVPQVSYTLSFYISGNPSISRIYSIQVQVGSLTQTYTFDSSRKSSSNMGWKRILLPFIASTSSTKITFSSLQVGFGAMIDFVSVSQTSLLFIIIYYLLFIIYYLLFIIYYLLFIIYYYFF
jgi:hypothetical protein